MASVSSAMIRLVRPYSVVRGRLYNLSRSMSNSRSTLSRSSTLPRRNENPIATRSEKFRQAGDVGNDNQAKAGQPGDGPRAQ